MGWKIGINSKFIVRHLDKPHLQVFTPDGYLGDEKNRLMLVVEVAHTQPLKAVLAKVNSVWLKIPGIRGIIVVKMHETQKYSRPRNDRKPGEPILGQDEWMDRDWPAGAIHYDGHRWIGEYVSRVIVLVNTRKQAVTSDSEVCCIINVQCSFSHHLLLQVLVEQYLPSALENSNQMSAKRSREDDNDNVESGGKNELDNDDLGYWSPADEDDSGNGDSSDVKTPIHSTTSVPKLPDISHRALKRYDALVEEFQAKLEPDWRVTIAVCIILLTHLSTTNAHSRI